MLPNKKAPAGAFLLILPDYLISVFQGQVLSIT
jgi:hypothetical protein